MYVDRDGRVPLEEWLEALKDREVESDYLVAYSTDRSWEIQATAIQSEAACWNMKIDFGPGFRVYFAFG